MGVKVRGAVLAVFEPVVTEKFKKREVVIECGEEYAGQFYSNPLKMQAVQDKMELLDGVAPGDVLDVEFAVKGAKHEKEGKVIWWVNLNVLRLRKVLAAGGPAPDVQRDNFKAQELNEAGYPDDLPF
ncbi:MAG: DUF3127 domain-containing protein [Taibaiella sp.]|nr:DUF3127 domain-containing protein [Taibaiella sp.]